jgi:hypothetical protein
LISSKDIIFQFQFQTFGINAMPSVICIQRRQFINKKNHQQFLFKKCHFLQRVPKITKNFVLKLDPNLCSIFKGGKAETLRLCTIWAQGHFDSSGTEAQNPA